MDVFRVTCILTFLFFAVKSEQLWWQHMSLYQIYPRSFMDSNGDGIGDLKGIESKLEHLNESHINAFWLSPIYKSPMVDNGYDASDFTAIDPIFGTMKDFENLVEKAHKMSIKVIMDFVPNHSSDKHEWFQKSIKGIKPYSDYYIWKEGKIVNGTRQPPNNWRSVFSGSAWTWNDERKAYYFHQFGKAQPDLDFRNEGLVEEMKNVLRFWMNKGVDGFRIDATPHLFEDARFLDEPLSGNPDPNDFSYTVHIYTRDQPELYGMMQQWRDVVDEYTAKVDQVPRVLMVEAYADLPMTMKYYTHGIHFPFNFKLMDLKKSSTAADIKDAVDYWLLNMPAGSTANWVVGNHDNPRLVTRLGLQKAMAVTTLTLVLPGISVTYNGEEIGMSDAPPDPQNPYSDSFRDPVRTPFQWDNSTSAGFSSNPKTWLSVNPNYKTVNLAAEKVTAESYYNYYKSVAALRKSPALRSGNLEMEVIDKDVLALARTNGKNAVYVVMNLGSQTKTINLKSFKDTPATVAIYRATPGAGLNSGSIVKSEGVKIPPNSTIIFVSDPKQLNN